jgi:hypothetical protein
MNYQRQFLIFDSAGNNIAKITSDEINRLIPDLPDDVIKNNFHIRRFTFNPNSQKILFTYIYSQAAIGGNHFTSGFYIFIMDANGKSLKRVPLAVDGIKSGRINYEFTQKEFIEFSENSIVDIEW